MNINFFLLSSDIINKYKVLNVIIQETKDKVNNRLNIVESEWYLWKSGEVFPEFPEFTEKVIR